MNIELNIDRYNTPSFTSNERKGSRTRIRMVHYLDDGFDEEAIADAMNRPLKWVQKAFENLNVRAVFEKEQKQREARILELFNEGNSVLKISYLMQLEVSKIHKVLIATGKLVDKFRSTHNIVPNDAPILDKVTKKSGKRTKNITSSMKFRK